MGSAREGESQGATRATMQAQGAAAGPSQGAGRRRGVHLGLWEQRGAGERQAPPQPPAPRRLLPLGRHTLVCSKSSEVQIPLQSLPRGAQTAGVSRTVSSRRTRGNAPTSVTAVWRGCGWRGVSPGLWRGVCRVFSALAGPRVLICSVQALPPAFHANLVLSCSVPVLPPRVRDLVAVCAKSLASLRNYCKSSGSTHVSIDY